MTYEPEASVPAQFGQRALGIFQTEGVAGPMKRVGRCLRRKPVHHSSYILGRSLNQPTHPPLPEVEVEIGQVRATDDEDLEAIVEIDPWADSKADLLSRLAEGHQCYIARYEGLIVSSLWWVSGGFSSLYLGRELKLAPNEIVSLAAFTKSAFRGKGIMPYLRAQSIRDVARRLNKTYALATIQVTNKASLRSIAKGGYTRIGRVGFVEILGIRFHYLSGHGAFREVTNRFFVERM